MEDSAMNGRKRLSAFFFTILYTFFFLPGYARAESPDDPAPQSTAAHSPAPSSSDSPEEVTIPGPLRSFLRMAAISQKISPEEVLPLLARNVVVNGFQGGGGKPTE